MAAPSAYLSQEVLDRDAMREEVSDPAAGAILLFEGTVRDHSDGLTGVIALEYEAQTSMAGKIIAAIIAETSLEIPVRKIAVRHRLGRVKLGEPTIIIAVSATRPIAPPAASSTASSTKRPSGNGKS